MNPSKFFSNFFIIFILTPTVFSYKEISYSDHCSSFAPEATPTTPIFTRYPFLEPVTSHYTGGQNILGPDSPSQKSIRFTATENLFRTNIIDTYKIQAHLSFISSNIYHVSSNVTRRSNRKRILRRPLVFFLDGFWSVSTNKLCMVGSASLISKKGNLLKLDGVLKLNFARFITLNTSLVSGILESLSSPNDSNYFEPISMLGFPRVADFKYNYSLVSNEECRGNSNTQEHSVASMQSLDLCSIFTNQFKTYQLEYQDSQSSPSLPSFLSSFLSLYAIQCSLQEKKMRFLLEFQDRRYTPYDQSFNPNITLIGDGTWNGTRNELCIVACHILNQSDPMGSAHVGDCSVRLSLWFPETRSIKNTHSNEGQIWSTKKAGDNGYFETIKFKSFDHSLEKYATKYEFTEMEKVKQVCPPKKVAKREGDRYPSGYDGDMTFDMSVKHENMGSSGYAVPIFVGNQFYNSYSAVDSNFSPWRAAIPFATTTTGPVKISYEIIFRMFGNSTSRDGISSFYSTNNGRVKISAEGLYDSETGQLCMVGCRNLPSRNASFDCEILVRFQFPSTNRNNGSFFITGSIESLREKTEELYFERLEISTLTYTTTEARESLWRMDIEIIMVMVSGTLSCFFVGMQLLHVKKRPEMVPLISVFMMMILTFGYMVPLVLNFEAMFSNNRYLQNIPLGSNGGLLEVNEVIVRIVAMVAFILQFRLLQLTWTAKLGKNRNGNEKNHWNDEIWSLVICLPMYLIGGLVILLMKMINDDYVSASERSMWGDLRLYGGLTLDGFLFPQLILNIFKISKGNALSCWFYIGNTFVRLLPHGYDLYRGQKNISHQFDRFYLYANPRADFYSPSWDVFIACGGILFAVMVFLQQRFGGRFMLPKRFQEPIEYEIVPVANNE